MSSSPPTTQIAYPSVVYFFFSNDPATTEIYTLSLHDALPISEPGARELAGERVLHGAIGIAHLFPSERQQPSRSEEHTSELQSLTNLVCRLLLEKKKT